KQELEAKGHRFTTQSDTEVVVHAYEEYDTDCLSLFNGMFAIALYDSEKKKLVLARDRCGIKPLYYTQFNNRLIFASEIKSILMYPGISRVLDMNALSYFLTLRYVPLEYTMFQGIRKVLPGQYITFNESGLRTGFYSRPRPAPDLDDLPDEALLRVIKNSVERHMISDVPVGVYLSGGLDSATIVAMTAGLSSQPINTFCMGFGEDSDELADARLVASHFGTSHHEEIIDQGLLQVFPSMIWHMDFPKRNLYPYYLAQLASKHVKVVLSGLGGDELFAGYDFRYSVLSKKNPRTVPEKVEDYLTTQARDIPSDQNDVFGSAIPNGMTESVRGFFNQFFTDSMPYMEQVLSADFNSKMIYDFLPVDDSTSMAHSVETRVPFLDNELVDTASRLAFPIKFRNGRGKYILRRAMTTILPAQTLNKHKQGFGPNPYTIYKKELRQYAEEFLPSGYAVKKELVNPDWLNRVIAKSPSPDLSAEYNKVWDCLALEVFLRIYLNDHLARGPPSWDAL
ncbi:MAG: asparagine synthase (glutamine-hydrolyzing), partial [Candidatus Bathyarchaeia archaeon]